MPELQAPQDQAAEAVTAASCVAHHTATQATAHLTGEDFASTAYWRVVQVCRTLPPDATLPPMPLDDPSWLDAWWLPHTAREIAAIEAGADRDVIEDLRRYHATEHPAKYLARLYDARRRRHVMTALADAYNLLGDGRPLEDVAPILATLAT